MKTAPAYDSHMEVLWSRIGKRDRQRQAMEANARKPSPRIPPMSAERRMTGYWNDPGHWPGRAPTGRQLRRIMRKAGILDPQVVLAEWPGHNAGFYGIGRRP